ncbi:hypothetical protein ACTMU2_01730 [Cupriavidus basilensis]
MFSRPTQPAGFWLRSSLLAYGALLILAVWLMAFAAMSMVRQDEQASVGARLGATVNTTARQLGSLGERAASPRGVHEHARGDDPSCPAIAGQGCRPQSRTDSRIRQLDHAAVPLQRLHRLRADLDGQPHRRLGSGCTQRTAAAA